MLPPFVTVLAAGASLNPLDFDPAAYMLTLILFFILVFLGMKFAWNPILDSLEQREKKITGAVNDAENAKREAERLIAEHRQKLADAERHVAARIEEGRAQAERQASSIVDAAREEADRERERAKREIEVAKQRAISEIRGEAVRLSRQIAEKVLVRKIDENDHRRIAEEVLSSMSGGK
jgi:F-type H+-transporting ATPase subunit b